jgi:hypothetical protein
MRQTKIGDAGTKMERRHDVGLAIERERVETAA